MRDDHHQGPSRPLVLISREEDLPRLCLRYAHLHSDLSPLTAWCHLLTPLFADPLESLSLTPDLGGMEAAWTGLIVAETVLLTAKPLANVRMAACLATRGFAIARTHGLWAHIPTAAIVSRFDAANRLFRGENIVSRGEGRLENLRSSLEPIWAALIELSQGRGSQGSRDLKPIVASLRALRQARADRDSQESRPLCLPLVNDVPEASLFAELGDLTPEMRVRLYDKLVRGLDNTQGEHASLRRNALALLAGYLATVAAGGAPSLSLAEGTASRWPEITAWAYLVGGIGEKVVWSSGFDGLGRLVARELLRPLRLYEAPACDFALDEANALVDWKLADPFVHLRVKQARLVTVALLPGVNVLIPLAESASQGANKAEAARSSRGNQYVAPGDTVAAFVDALWPYLQIRLDEYMGTGERRDVRRYDTDGRQRGRVKRKSGTTRTQLPLAEPKK